MSHEHSPPQGSMASFTVFLLLYGDYPELASRSLCSLFGTAPDISLRIGTNAIGARTRELIEQWESKGFIDRRNWYDRPQNIRKYPLMRQMFYDAGNPIETPFVMWFDDDSFLRQVVDRESWFEEVASKMHDHKVDLLGSVYLRPWFPGQHEWIIRQPWYRGRDPKHRKACCFVTGGWWAARRVVLERFDYPWPEMGHNGGDMMLGELCLQQDLKIGHYRRNVAINADEHGKESQANRRGISELPLGTSIRQKRDTQ